MNRHLTPLIVLACAATFACGGDKPSPTPPAPAGAGAATPAATLAPAAGTTAGGETGIAECDEYLRKYEACLRDKVPAAAKPQLEQALEQYRTTWRAAAAQPAARATLATTCQQAITTTKMATSTFGCQW